MPNAVPRLTRTAVIALLLAFSTGFGSAALADKPRDFGTPAASRPTTTLLAAPSSVQTTITNAPVCTALYDQLSPSMVLDGGGNSLVAWSDYRNGNLDIYVEKLNPASKPLWIMNGVPACKAADTQSNPQVVSDGFGGAIVVWQDGRSGTSTDIYAQRVNVLGVPLWTTDGVVVCNAAGDQSGPVAVADGVGGVLIAWRDDRAAGSDVYVQRLNGSGSPQWTANGVALCTAAGAQQDLAIASDAAQGAYLAWQDQRTAAAGDIYARRVTGAGAPQGPADGLAVCVSAGAQEKPAIVVDGSGGAIVAWSDRRGANYDVYAQRLNGTSVQWTADGVVVCATIGDQLAPRVCVDGPGGAFVTWQDGRGGVTADIYAQLVSGSGVPQWVANGLPVCAAATDQFAPVIQSDPVGGAIIAWVDARTGATGMDVYAQRVSEVGAMQWTPDGVRLCDAAGNQDAPVATADGVGGALVVWRDFRSTYADLYGQQVDATGQVLTQCVTPDTLHDNIVQVLSPAENYRYFRNYSSTQFPTPFFYWAGVGVRGDAGSDWDIEGYDQDSYNLAPYPSCFGNSLAGSYSSSGVDFVVFDENELHTPPGTYGIRASRYSGAGNGTVEFDGGPNSMLPATNAAPTNSISASNWTGVLDITDIGLTAGVTYTLDLTYGVGGNVKAYVFTSFGAPGYYYVVPKSYAIVETQPQQRYTSFTAPLSEYYGVVVTNETGVSTSYVLKIWSDTPTVGVGDAPGFATGIQGVSPNPAQGRAQVSFTLREGADVSFDVLDMAGRVVSKIPSRRWEAGAWSLSWDGRSSAGAPLSPGMYFVQMLAGGRRAGLGRVALIR